MGKKLACLALLFALAVRGQITFFPPTGSGTVGSGTDKQVAFYDGSGTALAGAVLLCWDKATSRLGIGTCSPLAELHLESSGGPVFRFKRAAFTPRFQFSTDGTNFTLEALDSGSILLQPTGAGSVGIGPSNTSSTGTLHVYNATAVTGATKTTLREGAVATSAILEFQDSAGANPVGLHRNAAGVLEVNNGTAGGTGSLKVFGSNIGGNGGNVASAATLALPVGNVFHITGTTNIDTINTCNALNAGRQIVLIFDGILTVGDAGNLKLGAAFITTADDTLSLVCDSVNWFEIARSIN